MKVLKKLKDWKVWVFTILPFALIAVWFTIIIVILASGKYTTALVITAMALLPVAVCLLFAQQVFLRIREKRYIRSVIAIVLLLLFLGLQITALVRVPDSIVKVQEKQRLHQIVEEIPYDAPEYRERFDAWNDAVDRAYDARTTLNWIAWGSYVAVVFITVSVGKHTTKEDKDKNEETQE